MKRALLLLTPLLVLTLPAAAQAVKVDMAPGLWESKFQYAGDGAEQLQQMQSTQLDAALAEMKKQFSNMSPEQRKQMEALMGQSGMQVTDEGINFENNQIKFSGDGATVKSCITQEQIDRGDLANDGNKGGQGCTSSLVEVGKNRFKSTQVCSGENAHRSEVEIAFSSPKNYTGSGVMNQTLNGQQHEVKVAMEGRWLDSDCGEIEPQ